MNDDFGCTGARFSDNRSHRYSLWRFDRPGGRAVAFIGLNPSTADEIRNDPTVLRCINFARRWGYEGMYMLNLFSYRSTNPSELFTPGRVINDADNDDEIARVVAKAALVVCAWGNHGAYQGRGNEVLRSLWRLGVVAHCLGRNKTGYPVHPLYQPLTRVHKVLPGEGGGTFSFGAC